MKILSVEQVRFLDQMTIKREPVSSIDLMERASLKIVDWISNSYPDPHLPLHIFCGPGNNGGDGLAVARMLHASHRTVFVYLRSGTNLSRDAQRNFERLPKRGYLKVIYLQRAELNITDGIVVDAIFGSGLSRPLEGFWAELVKSVNCSDLPIISIDAPSGLFADNVTGGATIEATHTLSLHCPKLAFLQPESADSVGKVHVLDIGLHVETLREISCHNYVIDLPKIRSLIRSRSPFDHKGTFGHALLICGGYGKVGAAILAARACLRAGVGKLTVHLPRTGYQIMQSTVPEAMCEVDNHDFWLSEANNVDDYAAIGIGCGIGTHQCTAAALHTLMKSCKQPLVLDADALNLLSYNEEWLELIPPQSILTPHPGEYNRLFGPSENSFERIKIQREMSMRLQIFIVYKGAYSCISTPEGEVYFNPTGNPGMATAGSGDVLTGIITGLLAQGFEPHGSCLVGVYLHGLAGDIAAQALGHHALIASDIVSHLGRAFKKVSSDG